MTPLQTRLPFPDGIAFAAGCLKDGAAPDPLPEECALLSERATPKRVREFALARHCAREAMARLGIAGAQRLPILRVGARAPRWPAGLVGSITHTGAMAAAAVARIREYMGIGIDLERTRPVSRRLMARIVLPDEQAWLDGLPDTERSVGFALIFSAKESIYKAINPITGVFLGYRDACIGWEDRAPLGGPTLAAAEETPSRPGAFRWTLLATGGADFPQGTTGRGVYQCLNDRVLTATWIEA